MRRSWLLSAAAMALVVPSMVMGSNPHHLTDVVPNTDVIVTVEADAHDVEAWILAAVGDKTTYSEHVSKKLLGGYVGKVMGRTNPAANADIRAALTPGSFHLVSIASGFQAQADIQLTASGDMRALDVIRVPANAWGLLRVTAVVELELDRWKVVPKLDLKKEWIHRPDVRVLGQEVGRGEKIADQAVDRALNQIRARGQQELANALNMEGRIRAIWQSIQTPRQLEEGLWFHFEPSAAGLSLPNDVGNKLMARVLLRGRAIVDAQSDAPNIDYAPLPREPLRVDESRAPILAVVLQSDMDGMGRVLSSRLKDEIFEFGGSQIRLSGVSLEASDGQLHVHAMFEGSAGGRALSVPLTAIASFDMDSKTIRLTNISPDVAAEGPLAPIAMALSSRLVAPDLSIDISDAIVPVQEKLSHPLTFRWPIASVAGAENDVLLEFEFGGGDLVFREPVVEGNRISFWAAMTARSDATLRLKFGHSGGSKSRVENAGYSILSAQPNEQQMSPVYESPDLAPGIVVLTCGCYGPARVYAPIPDMRCKSRQSMAAICGPVPCANGWYPIVGVCD